MASFIEEAAIEEYGCPTCKVLPGYPCVRNNGPMILRRGGTVYFSSVTKKRKSTPHKTRVNQLTDIEKARLNGKS